MAKVCQSSCFHAVHADLSRLQLASTLLLILNCSLRSSLRHPTRLLSLPSPPLQCSWIVDDDDIDGNVIICGVIVIRELSGLSCSFPLCYSTENHGSSASCSIESLILFKHAQSILLGEEDSEDEDILEVDHEESDRMLTF